MILETERLILRKPSLNDAPFILKLVNDPTWLEFIGERNVHSIEDARNYIQLKMLNHFDSKGFGFYLVLIKETNEPIGYTGFIDRDSLEHVEVGFAFLPEFTGKGYAFESTRAIMNYGKKKLNINPIIAITALKNDNSQKLLKRLGLEFDKIIKLPDFDSECKLFLPIMK